MTALIYWLAIKLYAVAINIASVFNPKAKLFVKGRKGLLSNIKYALINERRPRIWMHCASLGEFEQGRPLLERLREKHPEYAFVLTFFSPSGYEVRKDFNGADYVFYLPLDSRNNAKKFLDVVQPRLCIFVKYDLWYFLLKQIDARNIPAILISSIFRKQQIFFKLYGGLNREMLYCFSKIFVQDSASLQLLQTININDAIVAGDTRFDRVVEAVKTLQPQSIAEQFSKGAKVLVAGSTWEEDEQFLQKVLPLLPADWKLIVVPHEVHEGHIAQVQRTFGAEAIKWSEWTEGNTARVLILDKIGFLLHLYQYARVVWIGGGFGKGIHNTLEAAVYGVPVGFGPAFSKFREARELIEVGAAFSITDPSSLVNCISNWEKDSSSYEQAATAAEQYVRNNAGATNKIVSYLSEKNLLSVS